MEKILKSNEEWKEELDPETYHVTREGGTEAPGSGTYLHEKTPGTYRCSNCGQELFRSETKFDSGTGWPSFDRAIKGSVEFVPDSSGGLERMEVRCKHCGAHLGHLFDDGPTETGARFCMNSVALDLEPEK